MATLSPETISIVKSTAPVLAEHGATITTRFYELAIADYPALKNMFNLSHQARAPGELGKQPIALARAVHAYATHIENLSVLLLAVEKIAQKHVSFDVGAELYPIVGQVLIQAMKEVLGDAATDEIVQAWAEAYEFLADIFINRESAIREELQKSWGEAGFKEFVVDKKESETNEVTSFYLKPKNGGAIPSFKPGQYLSFKVEGVKGVDHACARNYSLSCAPGQDYLRISVKKDRSNGYDAGLVSNHLHQTVDVGSVLLTGPPCGEIVLDTESTKPIVLVSAGIGVTPMISMLDELMHTYPSKKVQFIHFTQGVRTHAWKQHVDNLATKNSNLKVTVFYTKQKKLGIRRFVPFMRGELKEMKQLKSTNIIFNSFDAEILREIIESMDSEVYFCGPPKFMTKLHSALVDMGIPKTQQHYQYFGPEQDIAQAQ